MRNKKVDKRIVLTGGGTTGHVSVNLALIPKLHDLGYEIYYIGSKDKIERELVEPLENVTYIPISTGKLRRFLSWENFVDVFRVIAGSLQSIWNIFKIRPNIVFSKGGFVSVPVLVGAKVNGVPSITHESDLTPGLANKLAQPFVKEVLTTFPDTVDYIKTGKGYYLGPIVRDDLKNGDASRARKRYGMDDKPVILVMGGSLGANSLNKLIRESLTELTKKYNVVHSTGKDGYDTSIDNDSYYQFEYINEGLNDVLDMADLVVSRAGSNAIFEFLYYKKPMLLIPLPTTQSRGDQIDNAKSFEKQGFALMKMEEDLSSKVLIEMIEKMMNEKSKYQEKLDKVNFEDSLSVLIEKIEKYKK